MSAIKLGITDEIGDTVYDKGQLSDATNLGDQIPNWLPAFKNGVDGVLIVAGDSQDTIDPQLSQIEQIFGVGTPQATITEVFRVTGNVRPDDQKGHEQYVGNGSSPNITFLQLVIQFWVLGWHF